MHVSATQLNMYRRCPAQYYFRYIEGLKLPPNAAMTKGKTVHRGIEENYRQKIETHEDLPLNDVLDFTAAVFDEAAEETEWDEPKAKVKDEALSLTKLYHTEVAPTIQPLHVEEKVEIDLDGTDRVLLGYIDLIDDQEFIRDTKTSKKSPSEATIAKSLQLSAYSLAYRRLTGREEAGVKLDYLVSTKTPKVVTLEARRSEDDLLRFCSIAKGVIDGIERSVFYPNEDSFLCSPKWCGYWDICHKTF